MASILIIDDDNLLRRTLVRALSSEGHAVREAPHGGVGLELYRAERSDLVITDLVMPEREGIETIRELRRMYPGVTIVAISGGVPGTFVDMLPIAKQLGANFVLPKPFELNTFLAVVKRALDPTPPS